MRRAAAVPCSLVLAAAALGGCGGARPLARAHARPDARTLARAHARPDARPPARAHARPDARPDPLAFVTAETENRLLVVDLRTGAVTRRISVPGGPQYVAAEPGVAVVASPNAGAATLLKGAALRPARTFSGFRAPHITEISPDGRYAFVVDDARGTVTVIGLADAHRTSTVYVGAGAHHMTVSPDQRRLWVALGESARTIVIADISDIARPRVLARFNPGFPAHDLSFTPDGRRVWVTSASGPDVAVFGAGDHRRLFRVPVGAPPQHIAFARGYAYLTSGYGSTIEQVATATGKVIKRAAVPYGSFELDAADGYVVTTSLLNGKLAIFTPQLRRLRVLTLAPATRDVAIAYP
jgi:DNA-binding beta-propeller fold protein YncE